MKFLFQGEGSGQQRIRWFLFISRLDRLVCRMECDAIENVQPLAQSFRKVLPRRLNIHGGQIIEQANESCTAENPAQIHSFDVETWAQGLSALEPNHPYDQRRSSVGQ